MGIFMQHWWTEALRRGRDVNGWCTRRFGMGEIALWKVVVAGKEVLGTTPPTTTTFSEEFETPPSMVNEGLETCRHCRRCLD